MNWIGPFILWMAFAASIPPMAIERFQKQTCWLSGFICACAVLETLIVAVG